MKEARRVISYATVSLVIYCVVSAMMYVQTNVSLASAEVWEHLGIALVLFLAMAIISSLDMRISVYVTIFVMLIFTLALLGAFIEVNYHSNTGMVVKTIVDALSLVGLIINIICVTAAVKMRARQSNFRIRRK
ncbi:hypothetical protein ABTQ33_02475 [Paucilactobacillus suebicus]|uniref:Integral membrane protein n=1 Tax=Paucilactobacillus suebicus DSM 5007 = KCTC 3549 TaxID=1423807 RepID=A0A0R1W5A6_9LACO|nr:hypothetical protein [Paucilactobacillus suebicus]KRM12961.1 hypothetical protein FD16_GL001647 [Paucilactobacillus suebicus DSM 5007 = KCTC 3549]